MVITDDDGRYVDVNPAACELFGRSRDELLGEDRKPVLRNLLAGRFGGRASSAGSPAKSRRS